MRKMPRPDSAELSGSFGESGRSKPLVWSWMATEILSGTMKALTSHDWGAGEGRAYSTALLPASLTMSSHAASS